LNHYEIASVESFVVAERERSDLWRNWNMNPANYNYYLFVKLRPSQFTERGANVCVREREKAEKKPEFYFYRNTNDGELGSVTSLAG
jgi:hypothetical protein